jgi:hypothetical protein
VEGHPRHHIAERGVVVAGMRMVPVEHQVAKAKLSIEELHRCTHSSGSGRRILHVLLKHSPLNHFVVGQHQSVPMQIQLPKSPIVAPDVDALNSLIFIITHKSIML